MPDPSFQTYVQSWIDRQYGTASNLAPKIGLSVSAFLRGVKHGSLGIDTLFRLALECGEPIPKVLRLAGKADVAVLLDRHYGPTREDAHNLTGRERELVHLWNDLEDAAQEPVLILLRALCQGKERRKRKTA